MHIRISEDYLLGENACAFTYGLRISQDVVKSYIRRIMSCYIYISLYVRVVEKVIYGCKVLLDDSKVYISVEDLMAYAT